MAKLHPISDRSHIVNGTLTDYAVDMIDGDIVLTSSTDAGPQQSFTIPAELRTWFARQIAPVVETKALRAILPVESVI